MTEASPRRPRVGIAMGSASDLPQLQPCIDLLRALEIPCEVRILSAHRTPEDTAAWSRGAAERGIRVMICAAGGAAHLAGAVAAQTLLPVIGIPIAIAPFQGLDSLLATVQMPPGVPVATVAAGSFGAVNAALLAAQVLALGDPALRDRLVQDRADRADKARRADRELQAD